MLKYTEYGICFQEVPNEVTLYFNISNCHVRCKCCHSKYLWKDIGDPLISNIVDILDSYKDYISCVCFMGGTHDVVQLKSLLDIVKTFDLKTCVYTGEDYSNKLDILLDSLDYLKVGPYIDEFGGLNKKTTNQKFYKIVKNNLIDKTYLFWKEDINDNSAKS